MLVALQRQHAAGVQDAPAGGIELHRVQLHGRAEGVGQVEHDLVEALFAVQLD